MACPWMYGSFPCKRDIAQQNMGDPKVKCNSGEAFEQGKGIKIRVYMGMQGSHVPCQPDLRRHGRNSTRVFRKKSYWPSH